MKIAPPAARPPRMRIEGILRDKHVMRSDGAGGPDDFLSKGALSPPFNEEGSNERFPQKCSKLDLAYEYPSHRVEGSLPYAAYSGNTK